MRSAALQQETSITASETGLPAVAVILPFNPKMTAKSELNTSLQRAFELAEAQLAAQYTQNTVQDMLARLVDSRARIDFGTYTQSIALFISPLFEKIFYLDIPVEEKVYVDESLEIRDLVFSKKEIHKYLVLVLGENRARIFIGNTTTFIRVVSDSAVNDPGDFMQRTDVGLGRMLAAYNFPLLVIGSTQAVAEFQRNTLHNHRVLSYVPGIDPAASEETIKAEIAPYVADWKMVKQADILGRLTAAGVAGKLVTGINHCRKEACRKKGALLVVEKNYVCATRLNLPPFYLRDEVDEVIEQVLQSGGDVEFVEEGVLDPHNKIALIMSVQSFQSIY